MSNGGDQINDAGQIVGQGVYNGQQVAVLLTPTPEPGSVVLLTVGVGVLAG